MPWGLLFSLLGPLATQGVKAVVPRLPAWAKPLVHAGVQIGGAAAATYLGGNPFGGDVDAASQAAFTNHVLGESAYQRWRATRPDASATAPTPPKPKKTPWG